MVRQWIAGAALFALISGYSWAEVAQPSDNILKEQFSKQYHDILKLDSITLKNLDSTGNQATWSAEGDISSREDMYTGVGMAADYYFVEKTWTKDRPVKFSAMLTPKGTPADIRREGNLDGLEKPEGSSATLMLNVLLHNFQRRTSARASKV